MREEVTHNGVAVTLNPSGGLEAVTSVIAFHIKRDDGMLLVELGHTNGRPVCRLPTMRLLNQVTLTRDVAYSMLAAQFEALAGCVEVTSLEREDFVDDSPNHVKMQFLRTVCYTRFIEDFDWEPHRVQMEKQRTSDTQVAVGYRAYMRHRPNIMVHGELPAPRTTDRKLTHLPLAHYRSKDTGGHYPLVHHRSKGESSEIKGYEILDFKVQGNDAVCALLPHEQFSQVQFSFSETLAAHIISHVKIQQQDSVLAQESSDSNLL